MNRRLTTFAVTAAALIALTGCTSSGDAESTPAAENQSVQDACTQVNDVMTEATSGLQQIDTNNPAAAADALRTIADGLNQAGSTVSNPEVGAVLPDLQTAFASAADSMEAVAAGDTSRASELTTTLSGVQDSVDTYTQLCGSN